MQDNRIDRPHSSRPALSLAANEVHVWHVPLDERISEVGRRCMVLNQEERDRAARFHFDRDRHEFCLSRSVLRQMLESYGVAGAAEVRFTYSLHGKPALDGVHGCPWLQFNLSHTRGMAVCAFVHSRLVGVDVEHVRDVVDVDGIVASHFAPEEQAEYQRLSAGERQRGFLNGWTRKEAFIKAVGEGLSYPLQAFAVTLTPGQPARFLRIGDDPAAPSAWMLADLTIYSSHVVALAVQGQHLRVENRIWSDISAHP
jgi:4'-phosphopantetheinyl transferase